MSRHGGPTQNCFQLFLPSVYSFVQKILLSSQDPTIVSKPTQFFLKKKLLLMRIVIKAVVLKLFFSALHYS